MANTCNTLYKLTSPSKAAFEELFNALETLQGNKTCGNIYLHELAEHFGIDYKQKHISVRGEIYFFEEEVRDYDYLITVETETAWTACNELFWEISRILGEKHIDKEQDAFEVNYCEEEPGCEVFNIRDSEDFFPWNYKVTCCGKAFEDIGVYDESYTTLEEVFHVWEKAMGFAPQGDSDDEKICFMEDYDYEDEDTCFNVYEYRFD